MAKRNKLEIMRDILKEVQESRKIKPTPLLRKSNLSSSRFKEYYLDMIRKELIIERSQGNGKVVMITEKGSKFLERYQTIVSFIDEFEL